MPCGIVIGEICYDTFYAVRISPLNGVHIYHLDIRADQSPNWVETRMKRGQARKEKERKAREIDRKYIV